MGSGLAVLDVKLGLQTALLEAVHALVLSLLFVIGLIAHNRYPNIRQFGWYDILFGIGLLALGSWVDILDQVDVVILGIPMGHTWQQAFLEKILGYTVGVGFIAVGFYQWLPWMIRTRESVTQLNTQLTDTLTQLDERVEAERLAISRDLHDDVAQRLTALGFATQLCEASLNKLHLAGEQQPAVTDLTTKLATIRQDTSECLKTIRQVCRNLRPDQLDVIGLPSAIQNYVTEQQSRHPAITFHTAIDVDIERQLANLSDNALLHLYRLIQESIRNAIKHSGGNYISLVIKTTEPSVLIATITDNGHGVAWSGDTPATGAPSNAALVQAGHLGVAGLRERAEAIHGEYRLGNVAHPSSTQSGTIATITCPLPSTSTTT